MNPAGWIGVALSLTGTYLLTRKDRRGWYVALAANGSWIAWAATQTPAAWEIIVVNVLFSFINVKGTISWEAPLRPLKVGQFVTFLESQASLAARTGVAEDIPDGSAWEVIAARADGRYEVEWVTPLGDVTHRRIVRREELRRA